MANKAFCGTQPACMCALGVFINNTQGTGTIHTHNKGIGQTHVTLYKIPYEIPEISGVLIYGIYVLPLVSHLLYVHLLLQAYGYYV